MSRADYAHWNEEADIMWWLEEGKHQDEPPEPDDYDDFAYDRADAYAEELAEREDDES